MWKAEKIELEKNRKDTYFEDGYVLKINDEWISNEVTSKKEFKYPDGFQNMVCDDCGVEGCNAGGFLMARYHSDKLLFIPMFNNMECFEEYSCTDGNGDTECPPHKWFTDGILEVEGKELGILLSLVIGLEKDHVKPISETELATVLVWEKLVLEKPKGFIHEYNLVTD
jgi:hypothetical protein